MELLQNELELGWVVKDDLDLLTLLTPLFEYWDYNSVPP